MIRKKWKKCVLFMVLVLFITSFPRVVLADTEPDDPSPIDPYVVSCSSSDGKHHFHGLGVCHAYYGSYPNRTDRRIYFGHASQCSYCNIVLCAQYSPYIYNLLGTYTLVSTSDIVSGSGIEAWSTVFFYNSALYADNLTAGFQFD